MSEPERKNEDENENLSENTSDEVQNEENDEDLEAISEDSQQEVIDDEIEQETEEISENGTDDDITNLELETREEANAEEQELIWHEQVKEYKKHPLYWDEDEDDIEGLESDELELEESPEEEEARIARQVREFHKCQIEAALYASGKPLSVEILSTKLEIGKREIDELINELAFDYLERSTALVIAHVGDRYQMQIKPEYTEKVSKFAEGGAIAEKYLRTLTIIALKQPILKSLVIKLRGTGAYEHVKYLLDEALIEAKKKGRSHELFTTDKYAEMFGLPKDINEMKRVMIAQLGLDEEGQ